MHYHGSRQWKKELRKLFKSDCLIIFKTSMMVNIQGIIVSSKEEWKEAIRFRQLHTKLMIQKEMQDTELAELIIGPWGNFD
ncbi:hypothetical protein LIER_23276 [Lithospermum erythrorhizon]|uniref:Uncharacterized protein n=1 Tax=Lithospermum erythrorhizon TaxID=34254 RepID=A0AAV3QX32_LITER